MVLYTVFVSGKSLRGIELSRCLELPSLALLSTKGCLLGDSARRLATLEANFLGAGLKLFDPVELVGLMVDPAELVGLMVEPTEVDPAEFVGLMTESSVAWPQDFFFMEASACLALAPGICWSTSTLVTSPKALRWLEGRGKCGMR